MKASEKEKRMVLIEWVDPTLFSGSYKEEEARKIQPLIFRSVGYLISRDDTLTLITSRSSSDGDYRDVIVIPNGVIKSIKGLTLNSSARLRKPQGKEAE